MHYALDKNGLHCQISTLINQNPDGNTHLEV